LAWAKAAQQAVQDDDTGAVCNIAKMTHRKTNRRLRIVRFDELENAAQQAAVLERLPFDCLSQDMHRAFLNVGYVLSEIQLRAHFAQFGLVSDTYLPKHTSGRNKGFGFVTFDSAQALDRALLTPAHVICGVTVQV